MFILQKHGGIALPECCIMIQVWDSWHQVSTLTRIFMFVEMAQIAQIRVSTFDLIEQNSLNVSVAAHMSHFSIKFIPTKTTTHTYKLYQIYSYV